MQLTTVRIAWRNLGRHKRRTGLAVLAIAVGQYGLLATTGLMHGYYDNIRNAITGALIGQVQIHAPGWRDERALDLSLPYSETQTQALEGLAETTSISPRIFAPALVAPKQDAFAAIVVGLKIAKEATSHGILPGLGEPLKPKHVLIGHVMARKMKAKKGDELAIIGQGADGSIANDLYRVQEIIKSPSDMLNQAGIVMNLNDAQELLVMPGHVHEIVVRAQPTADSAELARAIAALPSSAKLDVQPWEEIVPEYVIVLEMMKYVGYYVLVLVFIAAIAGITNTLMMSTFERAHEFGMLLALGTHPLRLVVMIVIEAVILGLIGLIVGTILGYVHTAVFAHSGIDMASWTSGVDVQELAYKGLNLDLNVYPRLELTDTFLGVVTITFTSLVASVWPAWTAAKLEPVEAMSA